MRSLSTLNKYLALGALVTTLGTNGIAVADSHQQSRQPEADQSKSEPSSLHGRRFMLLYDINKDGKVTPREIALDQAKIFGAMDIDNDRTLSIDELRRRARTLRIFRSATIFDMLDVSGDGKLSLAEIQRPSKSWLKRFDTNANGSLEPHEILKRKHHRHRGMRGRR